MAKKNAPVEQDNLGFDNVEQTLTKTEQFLENNARQVGIAVAAVVAVVLGLLRLQHIHRGTESERRSYRDRESNQMV
jgi:ElaB/YqjD/DUF883 family membrane-anchored ribosome-binding protein